ncbi:Nicotinamidase-related amidase [Mesorhizobium albiziae]|uniref:Nicotinamidase-related amidase n=1 Tax=Neomesorhizobium albiziae TaxID=335020 RepID=A0A1I3V578_9HYPH|nr:isochorismatase family protein [Mesorhizobium albiziae]GLS28650.1 hydrolase [Mesorhizobium albiziae]SFJ90149.1 Nicotinamidase-related amidase [Mesorhizobium albiziae]
MSGEGLPLASAGMIEPDDSILVVIDVQEGFLKKLEPARRDPMVDRCRFLIEAALCMTIPIFVTVEEPDVNGPTIPVLRALLGPGVPDWEKNVFGLCGQDDLREAILAHRRRTAVLVGLETDVCVLHSAVGLLQNGFRVAVVSDATAAPGEEHELGLRRAAGFGAELAHAKGVYYEWVRSLDGLQAVKASAPIVPPQGSAL